MAENNNLKTLRDFQDKYSQQAVSILQGPKGDYRLLHTYIYEAYLGPKRILIDKNFDKEYKDYTSIETLASDAKARARLAELSPGSVKNQLSGKEFEVERAKQYRNLENRLIALTNELEITTRPSLLSAYITRDSSAFTEEILEPLRFLAQTYPGKQYDKFFNEIKAQFEIIIEERLKFLETGDALKQIERRQLSRIRTQTERLLKVVESNIGKDAFKGLPRLTEDPEVKSKYLEILQANESRIDSRQYNNFYQFIRNFKQATVSPEALKNLDKELLEILFNDVNDIRAAIESPENKNENQRSAIQANDATANADTGTNGKAPEGVLEQDLPRKTIIEVLAGAVEHFYQSPVELTVAEIEQQQLLNAAGTPEPGTPGAEVKKQLENISKTNDTLDKVEKSKKPKESKESKNKKPKDTLDKVEKESTKQTVESLLKGVKGLDVVLTTKTSINGVESFVSGRGTIVGVSGNAKDAVTARTVLNVVFAGQTDPVQITLGDINRKNIFKEQYEENKAVRDLLPTQSASRGTLSYDVTKLVPEQNRFDARPVVDPTYANRARVSSSTSSTAILNGSVEAAPISTAPISKARTVLGVIGSNHNAYFDFKSSSSAANKAAYKAGVESLTQYIIEQSKAKGPLEIMTSTNTGFDLMMAQAAIRAKSLGHNVSLTLVVPHLGFISRSTIDPVGNTTVPGSFQHKIISQADSIRVLAANDTRSRTHADYGDNYARKRSDTTAYILNQTQNILIATDSTDLARKAADQALRDNKNVTEIGQSFKGIVKSVRTAVDTLEEVNSENVKSIVQEAVKTSITEDQVSRTAPEKDNFSLKVSPDARRFRPSKYLDVVIGPDRTFTNDPSKTGLVASVEHTPAGSQVQVSTRQESKTAAVPQAEAAAPVVEQTSVEASRTAVVPQAEAAEPSVPSRTAVSQAAATELSRTAISSEGSAEVSRTAISSEGSGETSRTSATQETAEQIQKTSVVSSPKMSAVRKGFVTKAEKNLAQSLTRWERGVEWFNADPKRLSNTSAVRKFQLLRENITANIKYLQKNAPESKIVQEAFSKFSGNETLNTLKDNLKTDLTEWEKRKLEFAEGTRNLQSKQEQAEFKQLTENVNKRVEALEVLAPKSRELRQAKEAISRTNVSAVKQSVEAGDVTKKIIHLQPDFQASETGRSEEYFRQQVEKLKDADSLTETSKTKLVKERVTAEKAQIQGGMGPKDTIAKSDIVNTQLSGGERRLKGPMLPKGTNVTSIIDPRTGEVTADISKATIAHPETLSRLVQLAEATGVRIFAGERELTKTAAAPQALPDPTPIAEQPKPGFAQNVVDLEQPKSPLENITTAQEESVTERIGRPRDARGRFISATNPVDTARKTTAAPTAAELQYTENIRKGEEVYKRIEAEEAIKTSEEARANLDEAVFNDADELVGYKKLKKEKTAVIEAEAEEDGERTAVKRKRRSKKAKTVQQAGPEQAGEYVPTELFSEKEMRRLEESGLGEIAKARTMGARRKEIEKGEESKREAFMRGAEENKRIKEGGRRPEQLQLDLNPKGQLRLPLDLPPVIKPAKSTSNGAKGALSVMIGGMALQELILTDPAAAKEEQTARVANAVTAGIIGSSLVGMSVLSQDSRKKLSREEEAALPEHLAVLGTSLVTGHIAEAAAQRVATTGLKIGRANIGGFGFNAGTARVLGSAANIASWIAIAIAAQAGLFDKFKNTAQDAKAKIQQYTGDYSTAEYADPSSMQNPAAEDSETVFQDEDGNALEIDDDYEGSDFSLVYGDEEDYEPLPTEVTQE